MERRFLPEKIEVKWQKLNKIASFRLSEHRFRPRR